MYINEQQLKTENINKFRVFRMEKGREWEQEEARVLSEHLLEVYVNDHLTMKLVCVAEYLTELALGCLFSEGMIESKEDVESVCICQSGSRARVFLKAEPEPAAEKRGDYVEITSSCCTDNHILDDVYKKGRTVKQVKPMEWKPEWIFRLEEEFALDTPLHRETKSTHSCFLSHGGKTIIRCEDIGRHNAMDKVIGYGLRHGIDLSQSIVYSSGRIPTDMAMKAIRSGIPVLVSKESPTWEAVELAEQFGLTLLCNAKQGSFRQYTGILR